LGQFLVAINGFIKSRNEASITDWLVVEPPWNPHYLGMIQELRSTCPSGNEQALEQKCTQTLTAAVEGADGSPWTAFVKFMMQYLAYLRDVSEGVEHYLETYELLSELQQRANSALGHATLGHLVLGTVVKSARTVCKLAIGLDRRPDLIAHLRRAATGGGEEGGLRETLPERAANILRQAFVTCLNDRNTSVTAEGRPEGKRQGIYVIANLCLRILFQCRKTRNATQIFENIYNLSPPLALYPKSQRVTYLYYLGRFLFQNSHFYRAQAVLQFAYEEALASQQCVRQRRHILVYLVTCNIILGRFPSQALLDRPESAGFRERFLPLCLAVKRGDLAAFRRHLDLNGEHADWFLHFRILLQLRNRCEALVWRSLIRRAFILVGYRPTDPMSRSAPTLGIDHLIAAFSWLERLAVSQQQTNGEYTDPDFASIDYGDTSSSSSIEVTAIESKLSSLIDQGMLNGFISHRLMKFAIQGAKAKGGDALGAGFPNVWEVLRAKAERGGMGEDVPGWKKSERVNHAGAAFGGQRFGPGMVVNLSGLRPIG
ncbi:hypothetical protein BAUCODRAFT_56129, partial [Baudoinia panamericana UAMH 10762]